ncbi:GNAT family N-acetyltransferase [Streptomyces sp. 5-8]|uniref:GNAT family N-acetyltransferase n=1 Tax=Streptomyces musisoli TaxID=2802280 RepID=A0ABS1P2N6_9ACTN|nr:GNAT family N-acetyltransferase [Streptomyces musisoli]MBY8844212.1 GNAT family N-acetyltransferase [Streptomyces sp. SP2-10]
MIRRVTTPGLFPPPSYSHASVVEAGTKLAFLAGAVPLTADGELVGPGDPVRQAEQVIANLREQLRSVGSGLEHVVATDVYVVADEPATLSAVWKVVEASGLSRGPHSSTLLGVSCLGYTGQLVEITATAVVPEREEERPTPDTVHLRPTPDTVHLRRAVPADARAVADVWLRSFATALPTVGRAHSDDEVRAYFRDVVVPLQETWVAEATDAGREVVGMMVLDDDELAQLYLAPDWRGRGLGDRFVALAKERSPQGLTLWTFQVNTAAHRFYERHGFVAAEYTDGSGNEELEPDVRYVWRP